MKQILIIFILLLHTVPISAETYYVSSDGSDTNNGTSPLTPWKNIYKVNSVVFSPGDAIYFRGGDTFFGRIDVKQSGITIGAYDNSLQKPVITGAVQLSNWTLLRESIYVMKGSLPLKNLFVNGIQMKRARYPNSGFLTLATVNGTTQFTASGMSRESGYWNGATARIRTTQFTFEARTVSSYDGTTITLQSGTSFPLEAGYGFYLDNVRAELDMEGEWYSVADSVYFHTIGGVDPNTLTIYGSCQDYGIYSTQNNITIQDLIFLYQSQAAIKFTGTTSNVQFLSNDIRGALVNGIQIDGTSLNYTIDGNTMRDINGRGIALWNTSNTVISDNVITNIGLVQGYGFSGCNGMSGIVLDGGSNNVVSGNSIDSVGYAGIRCDGSYNLVEKNIIKNCMLKLNDGGALYAYSESPSTTYGTVWRHNIIDNVVGNLEGSIAGYGLCANGIYMDHQAINMRIEHNTVMNVSNNGIFFQYNDYRDTLYYNTVYNCGGQSGGHPFFFLLDSTNGRGYGQHVVIGNIFLTFDNAATPMHIMNKNVTFLPPGVLDNNYYCTLSYSPAISLNLWYDNISHVRDYSIDQWRDLSGQDQHSKSVYLNACPLIDTVVVAAELILHGQFDTAEDVLSWTDWYLETRKSWVTDAGLDSGCIRCQYNNSYYDGPLATDILGGVVAEQWYRVKFSAIAPMNGLLTVCFRQHHPLYSPISAALKFPIGPQRKDYVCFLKAISTDTLTALDFRTLYPDTTYYLDNVSMHAVNGSQLTLSEKAPIFVNSTASETIVNIGSESYHDLDGNSVSGPLILPPYSSKILIRDYPGSNVWERNRVLNQVASGWNMASLPLQFNNSLKDSVFPTSSSYAFTFMSDSGYVLRDSLEYGFGYWLKFPSSQVIDMQGAFIPEDTFQLNQGWNMVGSVTGPVPISSITIIPDSAITSNFFGYNSGYTIADTIMPGKGYWVKTKQESQIVLSNYLEKLQSNNSLASGEAKNCGFLKLTDSRGRTQKLLFGFDATGNVKLEKYEMPPLPPSGIFDARFATGRMCEMIQSKQTSEIPILITSCNYPLIIDWDNRIHEITVLLKVNDKETMILGSGSIEIEKSQGTISLKLVGPPEIPLCYGLDQNFPNPFNPTTTIQYQLPCASKVKLRIYNLLGQEVATLVNAVESAGYKSVIWDSKTGNGVSVATGVYFYRIEATSIEDANKKIIQSKKMLLLK